MDSKEPNWDQGLPSGRPSPGALQITKQHAGQGINGDQMRRGVHVCSRSPSRERNWEAGGPAKLGGIGERKLEHLRLLEGKRERWKGQGK